MNELITGPPGPGWLWNGTEWVCTPCQPPCMPPPPGPPPWYPPPEGQPPWYPGANGGVSFGQNPPPNPIRGAFWYNGQALFLFDGAVWVDVGVVGAGSGGGTATGTTPPTNPVDGSLWFNGSTLFIWDGNAWVPTSATKTYIQATAPVAPNAGDQWWNGSQQFIWDGSKWNQIGPGATIGPVPTTTQVLSIPQTTAISVPQSAWDIIPFTAGPIVDTMSGFDQTTKKYTPNKAGVYRFDALGLGGGGTAGVTGMAILKNDQGAFNSNNTDIVVCIQTANTIAGDGDWVSCNGMIKMNGTTDYVRVFFYNNTQALFYGSGNMPVMQGWLMP